MADTHSLLSPSNHTQLRTEFDRKLHEDQPEVLAWLREHASGRTLAILVEICARTFEAADTVGQPIAMLKQSCLNRSLSEQIPSIDPQGGWVSAYPIGSTPAQRFAIGRMLRALLTSCRPADSIPLSSSLSHVRAARTLAD